MLYRSLCNYISARFQIKKKNYYSWTSMGCHREYSDSVKESSKPRYKQQRNRYIGLFKFPCGVPRHWKILNIPACKYWKFWNTRKTESLGYGTSYAQLCYVPIIISVRNRLRKKHFSRIVIFQRRHYARGARRKVIDQTHWEFWENEISYSVWNTDKEK